MEENETVPSDPATKIGALSGRTIVELPPPLRMPNIGMGALGFDKSGGGETATTDTYNEPERKPFSFALAHGFEGASIWHGCLLTTITIIRVVEEDGKIHILSQDPIPKLQYTPAENLDENLLVQTHLGWYGDVYAYWEADESGEVTLFDIRGPDEPDGQDISELEPDLTRAHPDGKYFILIGTVNEFNPVEQKISSDIPWAVTILTGAEDSSSGRSGSSNGKGSSGRSGSSNGEGSSSGLGSSESEKSSNAIVAAPWAKGKHVALATIESNQVLFEFVVRDIALRGRTTMVRIDPRFLYVCEPDSICVASAPCGDEPYPVGVSVKGGLLVLNAYARKDRRPKCVNVRLTGIRKGFGEWDMPSRTAKQKAQSEEARRREYDR